eukprot:3272609-Rhodomonas_salina.1
MRRRRRGCRAEGKGDGGEGRLLFSPSTPLPDLGFRVQGPGSRVEGRGSRVEGGLGCRVEGVGCRVEGRGSKVEGQGSRVQGYELGAFYNCAKKRCGAWGEELRNAGEGGSAGRLSARSSEMMKGRRRGAQAMRCLLYTSPSPRDRG